MFLRISGVMVMSVIVVVVVVVVVVAAVVRLQPLVIVGGGRGPQSNRRPRVTVWCIGLHWSLGIG